VAVWAEALDNPCLAPSHRWVVCTIATNVAQRELLRVTEPAHLLSLEYTGTHNPCMLPNSQLWPIFSSTDEISSISSVVIFTCQPIPRPNGFLSNDSSIAHFFLPSGPNCSRKLHKSSASFSSLIPGNTILVPGIFALGSLMYSLKVASSQTIPEFLFASE
jgi:hypothetical protein